jgi:hypothetical protein
LALGLGRHSGSAIATVVGTLMTLLWPCPGILSRTDLSWENPPEVKGAQT